MTPDKGLPLVGKVLRAKSQYQDVRGFIIKSVELYETEHQGDTVDINFYYFKITVRFPNDRGRYDEKKKLRISHEQTGTPEGLTDETISNLINEAYNAFKEEFITDEEREFYDVIG